MRIGRLTGWLCGSRASESKGADVLYGFRCDSCDGQHAGLPRDLGYVHPIDYYAVPASQRAERIESNSDLCAIDDEQFFIRGVLARPVNDGSRFRWGIWVRVAESDFRRYVDAWENNRVAEAPPLPGMIAGPVGPYPDEMAEVMVTPRPESVRPTFDVRSETHPLGVAQRPGVTSKQAHDFVADVLRRQASPCR